ncbi:serine/threonine-protein kinase [Kitasatospora sp. NPDC005748]|uniref:serine/threonine-protein kinase n=1 Tax=Kitasatospora sp. NPDC005748 TaxID=3157063 RepID=UPI0033FBE1D7
MHDQLLGGRYRLVRLLGEGGMGQVWEARDETLARPVAVKVISMLAGGGSRGDDARARFLREARITARLQHPNIVTIHDLGEARMDEGTAPFLVMELLRGESLDAIVRRGPASLSQAAYWGAQICGALSGAHDAGILHRDIKPSNIFVTPSGVLKVLDFGVARAADPYATADRLTQTGFIVGTPPYMAPEQARGFPEARSDLYALGCVLFELITCRLPFQAPDTLGYLSAHLIQEPPAPSSATADIPPAWDGLILTLLRKNPEQRYPNAAAVAQALRDLDHGSHLAPWPGSPTHPVTVRATTPIEPAASYSKAPTRPDRPPTTPAAGTDPSSPNKDRAKLKRFGPPIATWLIFMVIGSIFAFEFILPTLLIMHILMTLIMLCTISLQPSSRKLLRGAGYTAATLFIAFFALDTVMIFKHEMYHGIAAFLSASDSPASIRSLILYACSALAVILYVQREITTRKARRPQAPVGLDQQG